MASLRTDPNYMRNVGTIFPLQFWGEEFQWMAHDQIAARMLQVIQMHNARRLANSCMYELPAHVAAVNLYRQWMASEDDK